MALARGICPVCGEERAVRGGVMHEHNDPRTKDRRVRGYADFCAGIGQAPARITKTQEQVDEEKAAKKAEREKKEKKKIDKRSAPFKDLSDEVKEAFSKAVMAFEEPRICDDGRRKFLKMHGFPVPPQKKTINFSVEVEVPDDQLNQWGDIRQPFLDDLKKKAGESLPDGITIEPPDHRY